MNVENNNVVLISYVLKDENGVTLDEADKSEPFVYLHGVGQMIPGLEEALTGKTSGDKVAVVVPPEKGYGEFKEDLIQPIPKSEFKDTDELEVGMEFEVETENGPIIVAVTEVKDEDVIVDANHPLAGESLHFDVEVVEVRKATQEELDHGHAHGPDDDHKH